MKRSGYRATPRREIRAWTAFTTPVTSAMAVHHSSESEEWYTPAGVVDLARQVLGTIDLDPASCAVANQTVQATQFYDLAANGLAQPWAGRVWLNSPYGATIGQWMARLSDAYEAGHVREALALVPARVDTRWWQRMARYDVCFWSGRLRFSGAKDAAPFPSAIFYLGGNAGRFHAVFRPHGLIYRPVLCPPAEDAPTQGTLFGEET